MVTTMVTTRTTAATSIRPTEQQCWCSFKQQHVTDSDTRAHACHVR
jgi:hypothetical protein